MKRLIPVIALSALAIALLLVTPRSVSAHARTVFGFQIGIEGAPPPPTLVFVHRPVETFDPDTRVTIVDDPDESYDVFRYGDAYYVCDNGYWYRSRSYRGPFEVVDVRYVPDPIFRVPEERWRHYPEGLGRWNAMRRPDRRDARWEGGSGPGGWRDRDQGYGRGTDYGRASGAGQWSGRGHWTESRQWSGRGRGNDYAPGNGYGHGNGNGNGSQHAYRDGYTRGNGHGHGRGNWNDRGQGNGRGHSNGRGHGGDPGHVNEGDHDR